MVLTPPRGEGAVPGKLVTVISLPQPALPQAPTPFPHHCEPHRGSEGEEACGHSRVWHDGHLDCLIGDELHHHDLDGLCSSHGHVWMLDDVFGDCVSPWPSDLARDAHTPVTGCGAAACADGDRATPAPPPPHPLQFLHDGHVDYLVGTHLHHPTEGCHGAVSDDVIASVSLASLLPG